MKKLSFIKTLPFIKTSLIFLILYSIIIYFLMAKDFLLLNRDYDLGWIYFYLKIKILIAFVCIIIFSILSSTIIQRLNKKNKLIFFVVLIIIIMASFLYKIYINNKYKMIPIFIKTNFPESDYTIISLKENKQQGNYINKTDEWFYSMRKGDICPQGNYEKENKVTSYCYININRYKSGDKVYVNVATSSDSQYLLNNLSKLQSKEYNSFFIWPNINLFSVKDSILLTIKEDLSIIAQTIETTNIYKDSVTSETIRELITDKI